MTTASERKVLLEKIRLATALGFADDVEYWTAQLEELPKEETK